MASTKLEELLSKEMTRRQFLIAVGLGFLSLFGVSALMGTLTGSTSEHVMHGYGSRDYGR
jgi:hypothetical protein